MSIRLVAGIGTAVAVTLISCGGMIGGVVGGAAAGCMAMLSPAASTTAGQPSPPPGGFPAIDGWSSDQLSNAATIIGAGTTMGVPARGWIIAIATAIQESSLTNLPHLGGANNADSLGLFQQRPSQGWGTPTQLMDPAYASTQFYRHLLAVPGWQTMPLTQAAQAVQRSATPDAYAKWEPDATRIVATVGSSGSWAMAIDLEHCPSNCPPILSNSGGPPPGTPPATVPATPSADGSCAAGEVVLARADTWLTAWNGGPVPYLSSTDPATWLQGYRRDCSGYASMALGLPGPGLNSAGLAARATPIAKTDLRPGDLLINPAPDLAGHVVIFDHWTDATMTNYVGYEQSADGGTHHRTIPYPYFGGYQMSPYRL